jgi:hypothetical protein
VWWFERAVTDSVWYGTGVIRDLIPYKLDGTLDLWYAPE